MQNFKNSFITKIISLVIVELFLWQSVCYAGDISSLKKALSTSHLRVPVSCEKTASNGFIDRFKALASGMQNSTVHSAQEKFSSNGSIDDVIVRLKTENMSKTTLDALQKVIRPDDVLEDDDTLTADEISVFSSLIITEAKAVSFEKFIASMPKALKTLTKNKQALRKLAHGVLSLKQEEEFFSAIDACLNLMYRRMPDALFRRFYADRSTTASHALSHALKDMEYAMEILKRDAGLRALMKDEIEVFVYATLMHDCSYIWYAKRHEALSAVWLEAILKNDRQFDSEKISMIKDVAFGHKKMENGQLSPEQEKYAAARLLRDSDRLAATIDLDRIYETWETYSAAEKANKFFDKSYSVQNRVNALRERLGWNKTDGVTNLAFQGWVNRDPEAYITKGAKLYIRSIPIRLEDVLDCIKRHRKEITSFRWFHMTDQDVDDIIEIYQQLYPLVVPQKAVSNGNQTAVITAAEERRASNGHVDVRKIMLNVLDELDTGDRDIVAFLKNMDTHDSSLRALYRYWCYLDENEQNLTGDMNQHEDQLLDIKTRQMFLKAEYQIAKNTGPLSSESAQEHELKLQKLDFQMFDLQRRQNELDAIYERRQKQIDHIRETKKEIEYELAMIYFSIDGGYGAFDTVLPGTTVLGRENDMPHVLDSDVSLSSPAIFAAPERFLFNGAAIIARAAKDASMPGLGGYRSIPVTVRAGSLVREHGVIPDDWVQKLYGKEGLVFTYDDGMPSITILGDGEQSREIGWIQSAVKGTLNLAQKSLSCVQEEALAVANAVHAKEGALRVTEQCVQLFKVYGDLKKDLHIYKNTSFSGQDSRWTALRQLRMLQLEKGFAAFWGEEEVQIYHYISLLGAAENREHFGEYADGLLRVCGELKKKISQLDQGFSIMLLPSEAYEMFKNIEIEPLPSNVNSAQSVENLETLDILHSSLMTNQPEQISSNGGAKSKEHRAQGIEKKQIASNETTTFLGEEYRVELLVQLRHKLNEKRFKLHVGDYDGTFGDDDGMPKGMGDEWFHITERNEYVMVLTGRSMLPNMKNPPKGGLEGLQKPLMNSLSLDQAVVHRPYLRFLCELGGDVWGLDEAGEFAWDEAASVPFSGGIMPLIDQAVSEVISEQSLQGYIDAQQIVVGKGQSKVSLFFMDKDLRKNMPQVTSALQDKLQDKGVRVVFSTDAIDIIESSKSDALERVCSSLDISPKEMIFKGDSGNDFDAILWTLQREGMVLFAGKPETLQAYLKEHDVSDDNVIYVNGPEEVRQSLKYINYLRDKETVASNGGAKSVERRAESVEITRDDGRGTITQEPATGEETISSNDNTGNGEKRKPGGQENIRTEDLKQLLITNPDLWEQLCKFDYKLRAWQRITTPRERDRRRSEKPFWDEVKPTFEAIQKEGTFEVKLSAIARKLANIEINNTNVRSIANWARNCCEIENIAPVIAQTFQTFFRPIATFDAARDATQKIMIAVHYYLEQTMGAKKYKKPGLSWIVRCLTQMSDIDRSFLLYPKEITMFNKVGRYENLYNEHVSRRNLTMEQFFEVVRQCGSHDEEMLLGALNLFVDLDDPDDWQVQNVRKLAWNTFFAAKYDPERRNYIFTLLRYLASINQPGTIYAVPVARMMMEKKDTSSADLINRSVDRAPKAKRSAPKRKPSKKKIVTPIPETPPRLVNDIEKIKLLCLSFRPVIKEIAPGTVVYHKSEKNTWGYGEVLGVYDTIGIDLKLEIKFRDMEGTKIIRLFANSGEPLLGPQTSFYVLLPESDPPQAVQLKGFLEVMPQLASNGGVQSPGLRAQSPEETATSLQTTVNVTDASDKISSNVNTNARSSEPAPQTWPSKILAGSRASRAQGMEIQQPEYLKTIPATNGQRLAADQISQTLLPAAGSMQPRGGLSSIDVDINTLVISGERVLDNELGFLAGLRKTDNNTVVVIAGDDAQKEMLKPVWMCAKSTGLTFVLLTAAEFGVDPTAFADAVAASPAVSFADTALTGVLLGDVLERMGVEADAVTLN